jgi:hypothetical protein
MVWPEKMTTEYARGMMSSTCDTDIWAAEWDDNTPTQKIAPLPIEQIVAKEEARRSKTHRRRASDAVASKQVETECAADGGYHRIMELLDSAKLHLEAPVSGSEEEAAHEELAELDLRAALTSMVHRRVRRKREHA